VVTKLLGHSCHSVEAERCTLGVRVVWATGEEMEGVMVALVSGEGEYVWDCSSLSLLVSCALGNSCISGGGVSVCTAVETLVGLPDDWSTALLSAEGGGLSTGLWSNVPLIPPEVGFILISPLLFSFSCGLPSTSGAE